MEQVKRGRKSHHDPRENHELFDKYVKPNLDEIRSLVFFYSNDKQEVESNYNFVLESMYRYIHTYDPVKSLKTWIHIVAKRSTQFCNRGQAEKKSHQHGIIYDFDHDNGDNPDELLCGGTDIALDNFSDNLSDKVLSALHRTPPTLLSAFLLYYHGKTPEEIVDIEYARGYIDDRGPNAIKTIMNRVYMAKKAIRRILSEYGITNSRPVES